MIPEGALIKYLVLLFFTIISSQAHTNESLLTSLVNAWNADYVSLACSDNMIRLYSRLTTNEKQHSFIIHIFHKHVPYSPVKPMLQRLQSGDKVFKSHNWTFHAILYTSGVILDLDYTDSPKTESFESYFKQMWPQEELLKDYRFQIKPASLYHPYDTDGSMDASLYPVLTFNELKSNLFSL